MCSCVCRYQGYIGAALVLGGVDCTGPHLYSIYPHGSTDKLPYVTMGKLNLGFIFIHLVMSFKESLLLKQYLLSQSHSSIPPKEGDIVTIYSVTGVKNIHILSE